MTKDCWFRNLGNNSNLNKNSILLAHTFTNWKYFERNGIKNEFETGQTINLNQDIQISERDFLCLISLFALRKKQKFNCYSFIWTKNYSKNRKKVRKDQEFCSKGVCGFHIYQMELLKLKLLRGILYFYFFQLFTG